MRFRPRVLVPVSSVQTRALLSGGLGRRHKATASPRSERASERAGARAVTETPPLGLARLTQCPVFSQQQMKLTAEKLKDESREEGGEKTG